MNAPKTPCGHAPRSSQRGRRTAVFFQGFSARRPWLAQMVEALQAEGERTSCKQERLAKMFVWQLHKFFASDFTAMHTSSAAL